MLQTIPRSSNCATGAGLRSSFLKCRFLTQWRLGIRLYRYALSTSGSAENAQGVLESLRGSNAMPYARCACMVL